MSTLPRRSARGAASPPRGLAAAGGGAGGVTGGSASSSADSASPRKPAPAARGGGGGGGGAAAAAAAAAAGASTPLGAACALAACAAACWALSLERGWWPGGGRPVFAGVVARAADGAPPAAAGGGAVGGTARAPPLFAVSRATGARVSFWHDVPLVPARPGARWADAPGGGGPHPGSLALPRAPAASADGSPLADDYSAMADGGPRVISFVCEIPAGGAAKREVDKGAPGNPVAHDSTAGGAPRYYKWPSLVNYGAAPQTYEHPGLADALLGLPGDGDPLDVVELVARADGAEACAPGDVYAVRVLGALAMVEGGAEADWKVVVARVGGPVEAGLMARDLAAGVMPALTAEDARAGAPGAARRGAAGTPAGAAAAAAAAAATVPDAAVDDAEAGPGARRAPPRPGAPPAEWRAWAAGRVRDVTVWLRDYKLAAGGGGGGAGGHANAFAWAGAPVDARAAAGVIAGAADGWCALLRGLDGGAPGGAPLATAGLPPGRARELRRAHCAAADARAAAAGGAGA